MFSGERAEKPAKNNVLSRASMRANQAKEASKTLLTHAYNPRKYDLGKGGPPEYGFKYVNQIAASRGAVVPEREHPIKIDRDAANPYHVVHPIYSQTAQYDCYNSKVNEELRQKMIKDGRNPFEDKEGN